MSAVTETVQKINLAVIAKDEKFWPRAGIDEARVKEFRELYRDEPDMLPPVILAPHPKEKGKYLLVDGWHRVTALEKNKAKEVQAKLLPAGTDVFSEATRLSAISSKPLTIAEKRAAVRRLVTEHPEWEARKIARMVGVSHTFVNKMKSPLQRGISKISDAVTSALDEPESKGREKAEEDVNVLLWNLLIDSNVSQLNINTLRGWLKEEPDMRPIFKHVATVLYQAALETPAVAVPAGNVATQQK